jgi:hypothetical protein
MSIGAGARNAEQFTGFFDRAASEITQLEKLTGLRIEPLQLG